MLSVIVVILGAALRIGYRSADAGEKRIEEIERLRRSLSIIDAQIQASIPLTFEEQGERKRYFIGEKKGLRLVTNYSIWAGRRGYVVTSYRIDYDAYGKQTLYASENVVGTTAMAETALLKGCDLIEFEYLEKGLTQGETKWVEQWTLDIPVPEKIRVHVRYRGWDHAVIIPTRVRGKTA
jgi:hypothetical protein